jgi:hypothetical protein
MGNVFFRGLYQRVPIETPDDGEEKKHSKNPSLLFSQYASFAVLKDFLKPYYWPKDPKNQMRCLGTMLMVIFSKVCNISAPLFLSYATNSIIQNRYKIASLNLFGYCLMRFLTIFFQGLPL